jgi:hypothetical protein
MRSGSTGSPATVNRSVLAGKRQRKEGFSGFSKPGRENLSSNAHGSVQRLWMNLSQYRLVTGKTPKKVITMKAVDCQ